MALQRCGFEFEAVSDPVAVCMARVEFLRSLQWALHSNSTRRVRLPSQCPELLVSGAVDIGGLFPSLLPPGSPASEAEGSVSLTCSPPGCKR